MFYEYRRRNFFPNSVLRVETKTEESTTKSAGKKAGWTLVTKNPVLLNFFKIWWNFSYPPQITDIRLNRRGFIIFWFFVFDWFLADVPSFQLSSRYYMYTNNQHVGQWPEENSSLLLTKIVISRFSPADKKGEKRVICDFKLRDRSFRKCFQNLEKTNLKNDSNLRLITEENCWKYVGEKRLNF